jgi:AcrR family transcriptional regulator
MSSRASTNEEQGFEGIPKDRRVRKSQQALKDAFISLVLESGYEAVTIEDIAARADVARATFYAHFEDKEQLLAILFHELTSELTDELTDVDGVPDTMRLYILRELYEHAAKFRDLYLVCLRGAGDGKARAAYFDVIASRAEALFAIRLVNNEHAPAIALRVLGRAFAGAHLALLEDWLEAGDVSNIDAAVRTEMELLTKGYSWALAMTPTEIDATFPEK